MRLEIKKAILIGIIVVLLIACGIIFFVKNQKHYDFYYTFIDNENTITQSIKIYSSKNDDLQLAYYVLDDSNTPVSYTQSESAVILKNRMDLSKHPIVKFKFADGSELINEAKYKG